MGVDLHLINEMWYGVKEDVPTQKEDNGEVDNMLDYYTVMCVGIWLLRNPVVAQKFIDQAWTADPVDN